MVWINYYMDHGDEGPSIVIDGETIPLYDLTEEKKLKLCKQTGLDSAWFNFHPPGGIPFGGLLVEDL